MVKKMRLIDADELRRKVTTAEVNGKLRGVVVYSDIVVAPTIDPESLRAKGRWKYYHKQNIAVCMNCSFERDLTANFGKAVSCPNCGAKMEGE